MRAASKVLGLFCLLLTAALWATTLTIHPTPDAISAAAVLTAIVGLMIVLTW